MFWLQVFGVAKTTLGRKEHPSGGRGCWGGGGGYSGGGGGSILSESQANLFMITHLHLVQEYLSMENLQTLPHPSYCLDLALWCFFLFPKVSQDADLTGCAFFQCLDKSKRVLQTIIGGSCHKYDFCRDKHVFVATKDVFCRDKSMIVATNI